MFVKLAVFIVGLATIQCAPAELPASEQLQAEIKQAFSPVQEDLRSMGDSAQAAVKDLTQQASEAGKKLTESVRSILTSGDGKDRIASVADVRSKFGELWHEATSEVRSFGDRIKSDLQPIMDKQRSAFLDTSDAINLLQKKYLTPDGQALVKTVMSLSRNLH